MHVRLNVYSLDACPSKCVQALPALAAIADLRGGCRDRQHDEQALAQACMAHHGQQALLLCPGRHAVLQGGLRQAGLVSAGNCSQASYCVTLRQEEGCTEWSLLNSRIAKEDCSYTAKLRKHIIAGEKSYIPDHLLHDPGSNNATTSLLHTEMAEMPATATLPGSKFEHLETVWQLPLS